MTTISSNTINHVINSISPEMLKTSEGRGKYFLFLTNHQELPPLQKLYGLKCSENPDPAFVHKHIKKLLTKVHPDKVPNEEKDRSTQICQIMQRACQDYLKFYSRSDSLPSLEVFFSFVFTDRFWKELDRSSQLNKSVEKIFKENRNYFIKQMHLPLLQLFEQKVEYIHQTRTILIGASLGVLSAGVLSILMMTVTSIAWPIFSGICLLGGVLGSWGAARHVAQIKTRGEDYKELLLHFLQSHVTEKSTKDFLFIKTFNDLEFCFNEGIYNQVRDCYPSQVNYQIIPAIKISIIFSLLFLPSSKRPVDRLLGTLEEIPISMPIHESLSDIRYILKGILYLNKRNEERALEQFQKIEKTSNLYGIAAQMAAKIQPT